MGRVMAVDSVWIFNFRCGAMHKRLTTLIVDDEPLAIERLQILCARIAEVSLVGTATDGAAALRLGRE